MLLVASSRKSWNLGNVLKTFSVNSLPSIAKNQTLPAEAGHNELFIILKLVEIALYFY